MVSACIIPLQMARQRSIFEFGTTTNNKIHVGLKSEVKKEEDDDEENSNDGTVLKSQVATETEIKITEESTMICPVCDFDLTKFNISAREIHVNRCIDPPVRSKLDTQDFLQKHREDKGQIRTVEKTAVVRRVKVKKEKVGMAPTVKRKVRQKKEIPTMKILEFPGCPTKIAVDAFCYAMNESISIYLLTHFHSDHYGGLCKSWANGSMIICTRITARLVVEKFKYPTEKLFVIEEYGKAVALPEADNIHVTAYDANHCPGAGIFVIEHKDHKYLHCGDFRANKDMIDLLNSRYANGFDKCYLDTTYDNPKYTFPTQLDVVNVTSRWIKDKCENYKSKQQRVIDFFRREKAPLNIKEFLVVVGTYSIGKEKLALSIAESLDTQIWCSKEKKRIVDLLDWEELGSRTTCDESLKHLCGVHLLPMVKTKTDLMLEYFKANCENGLNEYKAILVIIPTGWTHAWGASGEDASGTTTALYNALEKSFVVKEYKNVKIFRLQVPYSEHSSYLELHQFRMQLNVKEWINTV